MEGDNFCVGRARGGEEISMRWTHGQPREATFNEG